MSNTDSAWTFFYIIIIIHPGYLVLQENVVIPTSRIMVV